MHRSNVNDDFRVLPFSPHEVPCDPPQAGGGGSREIGQGASSAAKARGRDGMDEGGERGEGGGEGGDGELARLLDISEEGDYLNVHDRSEVHAIFRDDGEPADSEEIAVGHKSAKSHS